MTSSQGRMPLVYIAGPFRGATAWDVEQNIRCAEVTAFQLLEDFGGGFVPIIPHSMYRFCNDTLTDKSWLQAALEMLRRCDAVFLTYNWRKSFGVKLERAEALQRGIPVFELKGELHDWLIAWRRGGKEEADAELEQRQHERREEKQ